MGGQLSSNGKMFNCDHNFMYQHQQSFPPMFLSEQGNLGCNSNEAHAVKYGKKCPVCFEINDKNSNWCLECGKAIISVEIRRYNKEGEPFSSFSNSYNSPPWNYSYSPPNLQIQPEKEENIFPDNDLTNQMEDMRISNCFENVCNQQENKHAKSSISFDFENPQFDDIYDENMYNCKHVAVYRRASNAGNNCKEKEHFYPFDDLLYPNFAIYDPNLGYAFPTSNIVSNGFYYQHPQIYQDNTTAKSFPKNQNSSNHLFVNNKKKRSFQKKKKKPKRFKVRIYFLNCIVLYIYNTRVFIFVFV